MCRLMRGLFAAKHIAPSQRRGARARAQAFVLMAAPIGAMQAESQRAAAAAQPLCSSALFWNYVTDPKHRKSVCATTEMGLEDASVGGF